MQQHLYISFDGMQHHDYEFGGRRHHDVDFDDAMISHDVGCGDYVL